MSQLDPLSPIGDILKKAESDAIHDSITPPPNDTLPTQEDILAEIRGKREPLQGSQPAQSTDVPLPVPSATGAPADTGETVDKTDDATAEDEASAVVSQDAEKTPRVAVSPAAPTQDWAAIQSAIDSVEQNVRVLADSSVKTTAEVREMHKLYHNEYASRLKSMHDELERYREIDKGRIFDGILGEVAKLYSDYESLVEDVSDDKVKKRIRYMLEDIVQILEANGVLRQKSKPGDKRNTRHCQVIERIPTANPEQHDTVAKSRGTGFYIENRSLIKEPVDIYLYSETAEDKSAQI